MTPSSSDASSVSRSEKTWKPPESVRIGPSQDMNACRPPSSAISSSPGRKCRWYVLPRTICAPSARSSSGSTVLTVPFVPTGMNAGVGTSPCAVCRMPARASPSCASSVNALMRSRTSRGRGRRPRRRAGVGREAELVRADPAELVDERLARGTAAEQRRHARRVRLVLVEQRREVALAPVAPEVAPLGRASCPHRISIASPKE